MKVREFLRMIGCYAVNREYQAQGVDLGAIGRTDEVIPAGWRKATYTFTVPEIYDRLFTPMIHEAMDELAMLDRRGRTSEFKARNGLTIHISYPTVAE